MKIETSNLGKKPLVLSSSSDRRDSVKRKISCICGLKEDNGEELVQCDRCKLKWEHVGCIFPRTKKVPDGLYYCHFCWPRPTELSREQARAYQDRVQLEKNAVRIPKEWPEWAKRIAEMACKNKIENPGKRVHYDSMAESANSSYWQIDRDKYSTNERSLASISRLATSQKSAAEIVQFIRRNRIVQSTHVKSCYNKFYGFISVSGLTLIEEVCKGAYIAELLGVVSLEKDCPNRDLSVDRTRTNDSTFLFENGDDKIIIDARKSRDGTRYLRRSCKPNAVLEPLICGSEVFFMIKATKDLKWLDEVTIKLEEGWMDKPRPAQGCACDKTNKKKNKCKVDRFFKQTDESAWSSWSPSHDVSRKKRNAIASDDSASEQPAEKNAKRKERKSKKRVVIIDSDSAESTDEQKTEKRMRMGAGKERQESTSEPPYADPTSADVDELREEIAKANDISESFPDQPLPFDTSADVELGQELANANDILELIPDPLFPYVDPPSSEVDKLREELAKTQDMYQSACSATREANLRAERAEEQLDSKPLHGFADWEGLEKELEKRLVDITTQLEEARRNPDNSDDSKLQIIRENDSLKIELVRLRSKEEAANRLNIDLEAYNISIKVELEDAGIAEEAPISTEGNLEAIDIELKEEMEEDWIVAEAPTSDEGDLTDEVAALKQELDSLRNSEQFERSMKDISLMLIRSSRRSWKWPRKEKLRFLKFEQR